MADPLSKMRKRRRVTLALTIWCALMIGVAATAAGAFAGLYRIAVVLAAISAGTLFALLVRQQIARQVLQLSSAIRALPAVDSPAQPYYPEWVPLAEAVDSAASQMQASLRAAAASRREMEALLDSMQDAVVAVDRAGHIQWANERMQRLLPRATHGTVRVGQALVQTMRDPELLDCVHVALEQGAVTERRSTTLAPGRIFDVSASPTPDGGAVAVLHDVTRIEEVERAQRDFIANVSHELRTPLTSIAGYVETLLDHEPGISAQGRQFLETISKNASRMTRLTEDLLVMARVEASSLHLHPAPVRSDYLMEDAVRAMSGLAQDSGAQLQVGSTTERQVFADHDAVMQVFSNLIENAIKYGRSPTAPAQVMLTAREIDEPYEAVEFCVADHGPGIHSEHLPRIFERFYRVDKTRSRESGGTGLGLSIVRHIVQAQAGSIQAESTLGVGSRFLFTLPVALYPVPDGD